KRIGVAPYPTWTSLTLSRSILRRPEVGLDHLRIVADLLRRALGDLLAEVEHRDPVRDPHDHRHVVLDQEHRQAARRGDLTHERRGLFRLTRRHARRGLVEEQEGGFGGERQTDLEVALLTVREILGQLVALGREPERAQKLRDVRPDVGQTPERGEPPGLARARLRGDAHVLEHRDLREDVRDLERLGDAQPVDRLGREPGDLAPPEPDTAGAGPVKSGDQVEERGFPGPVGPDHREDLALPDGEAHLRERREGAEALGKRLDLEDYAVVRHRRPPRSSRSPSRPLGMNRTMKIRTSPITMKYQSTYDETFSCSRTKNAPPTTGPARVPSPPIMTMMMNSPETVHSMRSGVANAERPG